MAFGMTRSWWLLCAAVGLLLAGCPGGTGETPVHSVKGRVVENGQPVAIDNYRESYNCLQVDFYPVDDGGNLVNAPHYAAFAAEDGSFSVSGDKGKGIPAGKYRVAVRRVDRMQTLKPDAEGNLDAWEGKFDKEKSPFIVEVTGSQGAIEIDLAKPGPS